MSSSFKTRKARKCSLLKKTRRWVLHNKSPTSFPVRYYNSKIIVDGESVKTFTIDKCKKIYEITDIRNFVEGRLIIRKVNNGKLLLDIREPAYQYGNEFDTRKFWLSNASGDDLSVSGSIVFKNGDEYTYFGHQAFSFNLLEKGAVFPEYHVYLTKSGMVKPYMVTKKYVYSLRDKVDVKIESLKLNPMKYMNQQLQELDLKFNNVKTKIPFPVKMIDDGIN